MSHDDLHPTIRAMLGLDQPEREHHASAPASPMDGEATSRYAAAALRGKCDRVAGAPEGTRNDTLNRAAFSLHQLVDQGLLGAETVDDNLRQAALSCGLSEREIAATLASGARGATEKPRPPVQLVEQHTDADRYDETGRLVSGSGEAHSGQVRMAYRLARHYADELLHVHGIGWHHFDGKRWAEDDSGHARRAVLEVLRDALAESVGDKQLRADVSRCESASGVAGVLDLASALVEFAATVRGLDADPWLLNCANGTLDLRTRTLRPHDPRDRLTRVTTGAYTPDADPGVWETFLASVLPDEAERGYLRRVIGQSVHGSVREHLFPVLIGSGANGKGTAYGAITNALGDYATVINPELLMVRERGGIGGPEMMTLLGARLVIGSETEEGRKLDETAMKRLTGGDELTARRLYSPPVTWQPSHQLVYVTNALPKVKGNDPAVWRRIRVVPFQVVVPPEDRDPTLPERLALHADAVLAWVVAGYFDYEDNGGMREPATVLRATGAYQADSDAVARFVAEACESGPYLHALTRELYSAWQRWAASEGAEHLSERAFAKELDRLGYEAGKRSKYGIPRQGIRPLSDDDGEAV